MTTKPRMSMRAAINAKCKSCIYDPFAKGLGSWREQVADCCSSNCPLHPIRPTPRPKKSDGPI